MTWSIWSRAASSRSAGAEADGRLRRRSGNTAASAATRSTASTGRKRIGPDLRLEPNYFAAAEQLQRRSGPGEARQADARAGPTTWRAARRRIRPAPAARACGRDDRRPERRPTSSTEAGIASRFASHGSRAQGRRSAGHAAQGRPQPAARGQQAWLRFPRQLDRQSARTSGPTRGCRSSSACGIILDRAPGLAESKRLEPIEIRALAEYLLKASQPFEYVEPPKAVTPIAGVAERKTRRLFAARRCSRPAAAWLAISMPISRRPRNAGARSVADRRQARHAIRTARKWLYSWVRQPNRYHLRTLMPNLFLEPIKDAKPARRPIRPPT